MSLQILFCGLYNEFVVNYNEKALEVLFSQWSSLSTVLNTAVL